MDATRNRGRGRFLACFRPLTLDAADYDPVSDPPSVQSTPDMGTPSRKKKLRRSLSAALKAVIFRTTLLKKSRSENSRDEYADRRISFSPFRGKGFIKSKKKSASSKPPLGPDWPSANASPLFSTDASQTSSLSSLSARSSSARSETESVFTDHFNPPTKRKAIKKCSYIMEICVVLMCLAALIWGKVFAVVACTSAWLFIAPGRAESYEIGDSEECRKRVIMEELLERDRSRVFQY
ncbi:hypothetical protein SASPL_154342 [Salvia splendens]|uniref:Uncharacterized protein n=1 Tax=Salvia splendens TaxID=180675 RepID=A0A8X8VZY8_SALSN|nr:uncharacterized protein LOC121786553 [Salvia splendens]KAG6385506.1 hypothetical protein SASPL_154342 [Salvia splendens]